ncbi:hypothetical protein QQS21_002314 [Conoideocrella luteorostrata]|uniref:Zn(2)-C6 fungal-type domain-containing protein n=1 Tax=Conoideocrella luteorostrata TaxID=1105319 RepID=A0AAJ0CZE3_9HYPO|nr:hypothetical protein QQS21_002314 [Conoideocrella luteorostrata]
MALTMADSTIRKACDRCHSQKLSCKRVGDEACERCIRLQTECKSSPSLRYKKHQQQQAQQYQLPQQQTHQAQPQQKPPHPSRLQNPVAGGKPLVGKRSPKRRRTASELSLVLEEQGLPILQQAEVTRADEQRLSVVETSLEPTDFDFTQFEQLGFFSPPVPPPLPQVSATGAIDGFPSVTSFPDQWEQHLNQPTHKFHPAPQAVIQSTSNNPYPPILPATSLAGTVQGQNITDKRRRSRLRNRPRQIALRHVAHAPASKEPPPPIHWMAQLSEINSRLLDLASVLPQPASPACNIQALVRPADDGFPNQGFPIDEMFQLTRRVADVLDRLSSDWGSMATRMDNSDPGNSMFVLSTYVRLLDMYQKVFSLVRMELLQADAEAAFRFWRLPEVQVGSFPVDPSPSLQMSLTIQLAEEFLARLRTATAALDPALTKGNAPKAGSIDECVNGKSMFSDVVDVSYRAVKTKEESLGKHLAELRDEIEAFLDH